MFRFLRSSLALSLLCAAGLSLAQVSAKFPGVGRDATPREVAAWDIDVRPDFKGLPAGSGSVSKGQDVWEAKCAQCHGIFGESGEVFSPLVGGTSKDDIKTGRVAKLTDSSFPGRTTLMKVPTLSTLWDYINRAMPWTAPKSLSTEEVYAVTAFLLNLGGIVPDDFVLSDKNMAQVQALMPNRNGMTSAHALWPGQEFKGIKKPDTANKPCMKDCMAEPKLASLLPDYARNAHGNLADQNRLVGPQRGADTTRPESKAGAVAPLTGAAAPAVVAKQDDAAKSDASRGDAGKGDVNSGKAALALAQKHNCTACHAVDRKILGPSFQEAGKKHAGKLDYLAGKIKAGGAGVWGPIPMPAQSLSDADARVLAAWIAAGAPR